MRILITGATGLIGRHLCQTLNENHQLIALVRDPQKARQILTSKIQLISDLSSLPDFNQFDAVINLAGEPIFARRWTKQQKHNLQQSRIDITTELVQRINQSSQPPIVFISASATGYYGNCGEQLLTEQVVPAENFSANLCKIWEQTALQAQTRTCLLRTGMVLNKKQGAFAKMLKLYRLGLGGKLGNGKQYWSWIALEDMISAIVFLLEQEKCQGAFNLTSLTPLTNAEFNRQLGKWLKRPYFASIPSFILHLILGERACLLLDSQRVIPEKLCQLGFTFSYKSLQDFLTDSSS